MQNKSQIALRLLTALMVLPSAYCIYATFGEHAGHQHPVWMDHRYFCALILFCAAIYQARFCPNKEKLPIVVKLPVAYACLGLIYGLYELYQTIQNLP